jgi:hypothetical protein
MSQFEKKMPRLLPHYLFKDKEFFRGRKKKTLMSPSPPLCRFGGTRTDTNECPT